MDENQLALAHYRLIYPTLASLGESAATWRAEYDSVTATGFSPTLITGTSMDGASGTAIRNFSQNALIAALHARRAELDSTYRTTLTAPAPLISQRHGSVIRLAP